jgi:hypothetical protein
MFPCLLGVTCAFAVCCSHVIIFCVPWRSCPDKVITPFTANCPVEEYQRLLLPILQVLITTAFGRLSTGWLDVGDDEEEVDDARVLEDMIEDRKLRELTRIVTYFWANMCIPHAGYGTSACQSKPPLQISHRHRVSACA